MGRIGMETINGISGEERLLLISFISLLSSSPSMLIYLSPLNESIGQSYNTFSGEEEDMIVSGLSQSRK